MIRPQWFLTALLVTGSLNYAASARTIYTPTGSNPRIDSVEISEVGRLRPGLQLEVTVKATPRCASSVVLNNEGADAMERGLRFNTRETSPGIYKSIYRIRPEDRFPEDRIGLTVFFDCTRGQILRLQFKDFLPRYASNNNNDNDNGSDDGTQNNNSRIKIGQLSPAPGATTRNVQPTIQANFIVPPKAALNINASRIFFDGREVTEDALFDSNSIFFRPEQDLQQGEHQVRIVAVDRKGSKVEETWRFTVSPLRPEQQGPLVTRLMPRPMSTVENSRPVIRASFSGEEADLNSIQLFMDGKDVTDQAKYDRDGILLRLNKDLSNGLHSLRLLVSDRNGNRSEESWAFRVR